MTIRVFVSGQSNALGRFAGTRPWSEISSDVRVWNNVNALGAVGSAFVTAEQARAAGTFMSTDRNNFGVWFCDRVARARFEPVDMTIVARGASRIEFWSIEEAEYPMLQNCIDVWSATGQQPADVFLWHQGEGDCLAMDYAGWQQAFEGLITNLRAGGVLDDSTLILAGGLTDNRWEKMDFNDKAILPAVSTRGRAYAASDLLANDGTHFYGDALEQFGAQRYYAAYNLARVSRGATV